MRYWTTRVLGIATSHCLSGFCTSTQLQVTCSLILTMSDIAGQMGGLLAGHGRQVFAALFRIGSLGFQSSIVSTPIMTSLVENRPLILGQNGL
jgi:hypothetical protein